GTRPSIRARTCRQRAMNGAPSPYPPWQCRASRPCRERAYNGPIRAAETGPILAFRRFGKCDFLRRPMSPPKPPRILIADDNPQGLELLEAYLSGTDYVVETA